MDNERDEDDEIDLTVSYLLDFQKIQLKIIF